MIFTKTPQMTYTYHSDNEVVIWYSPLPLFSWMCFSLLKSDNADLSHILSHSWIVALVYTRPHTCVLELKNNKLMRWPLIIMIVWFIRWCIIYMFIHQLLKAYGILWGRVPRNCVTKQYNVRGLYCIYILVFWPL